MDTLKKFGKNLLSWFNIYKENQNLKRKIAVYEGREELLSEHFAYDSVKKTGFPQVQMSLAAIATKYPKVIDYIETEVVFEVNNLAKPQVLESPERWVKLGKIQAYSKLLEDIRKASQPYGGK